MPPSDPNQNNPAPTLNANANVEPTAELETRVRNSVFAELRRAGVFGGATAARVEQAQQLDVAGNPRHGAQPQPHIASTNNTTELAQVVAQAVAQTMQSMHGVQQHASRFGHSLSHDGQPRDMYARGPNPSDRGAPARDSALEHHDQVWKMTKADVDALIAEKGYQAAAHELRTRLKRDLRGVRLQLPRG